jgi:hypothetical protein
MAKQGDDVMKILKTRNGILFLLLMAGLIFNILWSLRLESAAQELSAKVIEHHSMLSQNKDVLSMLNVFMRQVAGAAGISSITADGNGVEILAGKNSIKLDGNSIFLGSTETQLIIDDSGMGLHWPAQDMHLSLDKTNDSASIYSVEADMQISLFPGKKEIILSAGGDAGSEVKLSKDEISLRRGSLDFWMDEDDGVNFQVRPKEGKPLNFSMDPTLKEMYMGVGGEDFYVKFYSDTERIVVRQGKSFLGLGPGPEGYGAFIQLRTDAGETSSGKGISISENKGIHITSEDKRMDIHGKELLDIDFDGDINIKAKGNIKIRSEQGDVKINGKKLLLNE